MAHQAHSLPWQTLAANFEQRRIAEDKYLLAPQGKQIIYFTVAFSRALVDFSAAERHKHSPRDNAQTRIEDDDEIVSETAVQRLHDYFYQIRREITDAKYIKTPPDEPPFPQPKLSVQRYSTDSAGNVIRTEEEIAAYDDELRRKRDASRSARCWKETDWYYARGETTDVLTMWLVLGEMETLFKIARDAPETVKRMWSWNSHDDGCGLKQLMERTVDFYIGLNVLYCKPEWYAEGESAWQSYFDEKTVRRIDPERDLERYRTGWPFANPNGPLTTAELPPPESVPIRFVRRKDYRSTPIYSAMLSDAKIGRALGPYRPLKPGYAWSIPHWQFFGYDATISYGGWPNAAPNPPADPLKHGGGQRLREYLKVCWEILVRLDMLMGEVDVQIDWQQIVSCSIADWYLFEPIDWDKWCTRAWRRGSEGELDMSRCGFMVERFV